jgi:CelD/BcsL family acetyltransferase involved in cellulose biosynthesis
MLKIERLRGQVLPEELRADWNRLSGDIPFRRWEWLANWWNRYQEETELYVLLARDETGVLRGIAPWQIRKTVAGGRVIEPLGGGKVSSDYVGLHCDCADAEPVAEAIAKWLSDANQFSSTPRGDGWDLLFLRDIPTTDTTLVELAARLRDLGCASHQRDGLRTWRIPLVGDWEAYVATLSKPVRRQARRTTRMLEEQSDINYCEVTDTASLERGFAILVDLHQRRWEHLGIAGCFSEDRFTRFLSDVCRDFLAIGKLHLSWLERQGKPFVVNIEFNGGDIDYVYQGGMDPDARDLSPGWMHMVHLFRRSMALGRTHRDYLRGDEPYKKHWRGKPTQLVDLRIVPPHVSARLRHGVWMLGDSLKHWVKERLRGAPATTEPTGKEPAGKEVETSENS